MKKRLVIAIGLLIALTMVFAFAVNRLRNNVPSQQEMCKKGVAFYTNQRFQGQVLDKFIDRENHMYKTVVVQLNDMENSYYFDADTAGIFNYLTVGDSVVKNSGELFIKIYRNGQDTTINYKFRCY